jgi:uncharacterized protein DUF4440
MRSAFFVALVACLATTANRAQQSQYSFDKTTILTLGHALKPATNQRLDMNALDSVVDDAFISVDQDGKVMTKAELFQFLRNTKSLRYLLEGIDVRLHGDTAIVTGLYRLSGFAADRPFMQRGRFVDTWMRRNGRWVAIASLSTPDH